MIYEYADGYRIIQAVCFDDGGGFAIGIYEKSAFPLATWQFTEQDDERNYYCGYYFTLDDSNTAKLDYERRIEHYKQDYPGIQEKYHYGDYSMIDDIIKNISAHKRSILEQIAEYERRILKRN